MGTPGLVTVVVASYNHAAYLPERMESLIGQTYRNLEILVIDDCSPDDSVAVLRRYESDPRVKLVARDRNAGWVAVSNQGIAMASGEFVLFANCDDACEPRMIERLVDALRPNPSAGIAFCRSRLVDEKGRVLGEDVAIQERAFRARCEADTLLAHDEMSRFLRHACVIPNLSAALFRRECFAEVGDLSASFKACSDWELFFRIARRYDVAYVAEPLNLFRQHEATIRSVMKERDTYEEYFTILLAETRAPALSAAERARARLRVMELWAGHLVSKNMSGWTNFRYHLEVIRRLDSAALLFLMPALAGRVVDLVGKLVQASRARLPAG
jgi:glycosyltransferase involved in cell wall biosynthesis